MQRNAPLAATAAGGGSSNIISGVALTLALALTLNWVMTLTMALALALALVVAAAVVVRAEVAIAIVVVAVTVEDVYACSARCDIFHRYEVLRVVRLRARLGTSIRRSEGSM
jgi:hypothetical protein